MDETLPKQEQLSKPETLATPDVTKALATINDTETKISERFGLAPDAPELPDLTDDALVHVAESAIDLTKDHPEQSEVAKDAVKTVLIEGVLEVTGDRPEGTENPIIKLENDGHGEEVTEAVRKFHEEGAILPNGDSVAETIAITIMSQEMTSEEYDEASKEAGWDSPERAQRLVEGYVTPGSKVLDIGIGTGQAVNGYAEKGATVIGLDHNASMLDKAGAIVGENGSLRQADINKELPIADLKESVDVAQAIGVLEFAEDLPAVLEQVHGSLKENGVFVFTSELVDDTHPNKSQFEDIGLTVHRHTAEEIQGLLEQKGYKLLSQEAYDGYEREDGEVPYGIFLAQKNEKIAATPEQELAKVFGEVRPLLESSDEAFEQGAKEFIAKRVAELGGQSSIDVSKDVDLDSESIRDFIPAEAVMEPDAESNGFRLDDPEAYAVMLQQIRNRYQRMIEKAPDDPEAAYRNAVLQGTHEGQAAYFNGFTGGDMQRRQSLLFLDLGDERKPLSVSELKGSAYCFERAGIVHNMLNIAGMPSSLETGRLTTTKSDGSSTNEFHALVRIEPTTSTEYLLDVMNPSITTDESGKLLSAKPSLYPIDSEWRGSLEGTLAARKKNANGEMEVTTSQIKFEAGGRFTEPAETATAKEVTNPYERLTPEQLTAVRDNIADSIVQGIRKYDPAEVTRASANLAAIQRELEARSPEAQPAHQRGEVAGEVTYVTEPDPAVIQKIVTELQKIDGAPDIARKLYGGLEIPPPNEQDKEARLQAMEMQGLLAGVSREIRTVTGSEFSESTNPYASMKNEELATTVDRLKQTIQELTAQGADTTDYRNRLAQAGAVIRGRG
jgi:SAM-dependent methyltransferase